MFLRVVHWHVATSESNKRMLLSIILLAIRCKTVEYNYLNAIMAETTQIVRFGSNRKKPPRLTRLF